MPIEMGPPSPQVQPFNITPVQYQDPLETLARMQQLKTQNIQQQNAQLQLQQAQMQMQSNKAMLDAFVGGGGDPDKTYQLMTQSGKVLPDHLLTYQQHVQQYQTQKATLRKDQQAIADKDSDTLAGLYTKVANLDNPTQDDWNAANSEADRLGVSQQIPRTAIMPTDKQHMLALANGIGSLSQINERTLKGAQIAGEQAGTEEKQTTTEKNQRDLATTALQQATDPNTGFPSLQDQAAIAKRYPKASLPIIRTPADMQTFLTGAVPAKDLPDYQLKQMKLKMGIFGDNPEEQFLARYAQQLHGPGTSLAGLSFPEYQRGMQLYAETKQDPVMRQIALAQKNLQEQLTQAQIASLPNPQSIDMFANMMLNHDMSPSQFAELRSGRVAWAPQVFTRAAQIAQQKGQTFSPSTLEADYGTMQSTEQKFANGPEAQMARSFSNLMEHVGLLDEARKALPGADLPFMQAIGNAIGVKVGGTAQTAYDTIADYVASEAAKAFIPSGGGEAERAKNAAHFERNLGDAQIQKNEKVLMDLADAQRRGLEFQYKKGTYGKGSQDLFTPQAHAVRDRFLGPETPAPTPVGTTPSGPPPGAPPGAVAVPLKSGTTLWLTPAAAAQLRKDHPERVK